MASKSKIELYFSSGENGAQLERTVFFHELLSAPLITSIGNPGAAGARSENIFKWGGAVQAMSLLFVRSKHHGIEMPDASPYVLEGSAGTPATSLDAALSKPPNWLLDMFGVDSHGAALAQRLFNRTNPERKRSGPVGIAINPSQLVGDRIRVFVGAEEAELNALESLEQSLSIPA